MVKVAESENPGDFCCLGEYQCKKCKRGWTSKRSWKGYSQKCKVCDTDVLPHKLLDDVRCFGQYACKKCNRRWMSGNSWYGFGQKCRTCIDTYVLPHKLRSLLCPDGLDKSNPKKPHLREFCQKCWSLGGFCGKQNK